MKPELLKSHKTFDGFTQYWRHDSVETGTPMNFSTFIPGDEAKGCLIWLSGLTCTEENFMVKAGAQRYLAEHRLMIICSDTSPRGLNLPGEHDSWDFGSGAGFYVDATTHAYSNHYRMFSYVSNELCQLIREYFHIAENKISIMGHSMGGHGALVLALREPEKFQSVSAFAPIANPSQCPWGIKAFKGYLGEKREAWANYDATELVKRGQRHPRTILIDQGSRDEFLERELLPQSFISACREAGQSLEFQFREGYDHSYYFISTFIGAHITFHLEALQTK